MAIGGYLAVGFVFALLLPAVYAALALSRRIRPSFDSIFRLLASGVAIPASLRLIWLVFYGFDSVGTAGLSGQDRFYLLVGGAAALWYGAYGVATVFNKVLKVEFRDEEE